MKRILLIDNYDSFTYNLYYLIQENYSGEVVVKRNDDLLLEEVANYQAIVISPGPGTPANSGMTMEVLAENYTKKAILGVCLGMQCINEFFGGKTVKAPFPIHGKQSQISILKPGLIMKKLKEPVLVGRYHSLIISRISPDLQVTAKTLDGLPMVIEHSKLPIFGIQFHPESFLTQQGKTMIKNFLELLEKL